MSRLALLLPLILIALPASAQQADRYRMERTDGGFVRMDTQTGQMSFCTEQSGQLVCKDAADHRAAYADQVEALSDRVEALEEQLAALGQSGPRTDALPSEEEFEQTLGFMERFLRRFMGIVKDLEGEAGRDGEPVPDRT